MPATSTPPGPKGHWISGNLPEFRRDRLGFLTDCRRRFGDLFALRLGPRRVWVASHPDLIEEVVVNQSQNFIKHFALRLNPLVLGKGLLTSEGDFWLRQRRLIQPVFLKSRIASYAPDMVEETLRRLATWKAGETRDMNAEMMAITLAIAARTLFHEEVEGEAAAIARALHVMQEHFISRFSGLLPLPLWLPTPGNLRVRRAVRGLDAVLYRFIRRRREQPTDSNDLLTLLLRARDEGDGKGMSDKQLRDEAMTLFLAGHETTALALSWSWYLLATHPEAASKLRAEANAVVGNRPANADDWPKLRYAEMVALEAMRLYPPAYVIGREALVDTQLGGYSLPRGTTVLMSQWVVQRDERFFADPLAFRPERWEGEEAKRVPKYAYFPFGGGPRLCIGNTFAMMEMALVLTTIAQRFAFTLQPGVKVEPHPTFTLRMKPGVPAPVQVLGIDK